MGIALHHHPDSAIDNMFQLNKEMKSPRLSKEAMPSAIATINATPTKDDTLLKKLHQQFNTDNRYGRKEMLSKIPENELMRYGIGSEN